MRWNCEKLTNVLRMSMMFDQLQKKFDEAYASSSHEPIHVFSPSRVNIIGEHIDYNGGSVLPCAIEIGTYAVARKNDEKKLRLISGNFELGGEFDFPYPQACGDDYGWMNYAFGVAKYIEEAGYQIGGADIYLEGNIPNGAGLSSSASLELLLGEIFNLLYNDGQIDKVELVKIGMHTENDFIGLHTGIMDQFIIALGKKDHAMLLNTSTLDYKYYPFELGNNSLVIMSTNYRRELKDSKYNERRRESDEALAILQKVKPAEALCDYGVGDLDLLDHIESAVVRNRARHAILENDRVAKAVEALTSGDIEDLGRLLRQSNDSLRELYEVTGPYLDAVTKHANDHPACLGARMTGAGFGGCAIAIVKNEGIEDFKEYVGKHYEEDTGIKAMFISSGVADGVKQVI